MKSTYKKPIIEKQPIKDKTFYVAKRLFGAMPCSLFYYRFPNIAETRAITMAAPKIDGKTAMPAN